MKFEFDKEQVDILKQAVEEFEEKYYSSEGQKWQRKINKIMEML